MLVKSRTESINGTSSRLVTGCWFDGAANVEIGGQRHCALYQTDEAILGEPVSGRPSPRRHGHGFQALIMMRTGGGRSLSSWLPAHQGQQPVSTPCSLPSRVAASCSLMGAFAEQLRIDWPYPSCSTCCGSDECCVLDEQSSAG